MWVLFEVQPADDKWHYLTFQKSGGSLVRVRVALNHHAGILDRGLVGGPRPTTDSQLSERLSNCD